MLFLAHTEVHRLASPGSLPKLEEQGSWTEQQGCYHMVWVSEWWRRR